MISRVEMGGRSSCQRHFYQWIINHYIHPGSICGSITTYPPGPPMIHWISAGLKAKSFRFPFFLVGIPFFFLQHCKRTTLTTRKKKQKTTYRCFLKIHDSDLVFLRIGKGYSPPNHCSPISTDQRTGLLNAGQAFFSYPTYLEVSQRCDSFWMCFGPKTWGEEEFYKHFDVFWLVVEPTHLTNMSQIGSFPQVGMDIKKSLKPPPSLVFIFEGVLFFLFGRGKVFPKNWIDMSYVWNLTRRLTSKKY